MLQEAGSVCSDISVLHRNGNVHPKKMVTFHATQATQGRKVKCGKLFNVNQICGRPTHRVIVGRT